MPGTGAVPETRQSTRFLLLYALAAAGGAVAYVPFLTVLLPVRVTALAGEADVSWLAYVTLGGALTASVANILFGWLSDLTRNRVRWILTGLVLSSSMLMAIPVAQSLTVLIGTIVLWQLGLNMMLAPLAAWAGDCVPDGQKGLLGGLLAFAPALGAASGALVTIPGLADAETRLVMVVCLVAALVLPVVLFGRPRPMPQLMEDSAPGGEQSDRPVALKSRSAVLRMWLARLLVQIAEAALFAYLLFWFRSIDAGMGDNHTARIFAIVLGIAVPLAILVGRWSDIRDRPILPLALASVLSSGGLIVMALAQTLTVAIAGYVLFGLAASVFLSLHTGQTLRVLPRARHRARDLGIFNLTNTVPSLIMPWLTLALVPVFGFSGLFWLLAALAALAGALLASLTRLSPIS
ncbi:MFS transporter [Parerythrobacter aestuarii]|uniref:MFS transporter n=1 Tax=Parerythrobacter aestuarii TaxID=3020909 RepID=UPI0024DE8C0E|nr:MFS transporter [Parerythrobacter aestuarii]